MTDKKIKEKVKKRERIVDTVKRHASFLGIYDPSIHRGEVQSRLDKIEVKFDEFEEIQEEIAELDADGKFEEECSKAADEFEKLYYSLRAALLAKLPSEDPPADLNNSIGRAGLALGAHTGVRLPQISLPEFNGDIRVWLSFKSTYMSLIHESGELSDVQKFHYLKSALKGEAAKLIESLAITSDNYNIAWDTVTKRYSNEYLLKKRHLQALMEYPKVEKESSSAIHALVDEFEQRLKILKQLGEKTEHWGAMIVHWMCSKLDMRTLQLWEDHAASTKDPTFAILVNFLEKRTGLEAVSSNVELQCSSQKSEVRRQKVVVHAATDSEQRSGLVCCCCGESHFLGRCGKFNQMTLKEKLQFVNSKRLCSNCLKSGHWVRDCNSKFSCRDCGKKHNSLIHPGFSPSSSGAGNSDHLAGKAEKKRNGTVATNVATNEEEAEQEIDDQEAVGTYNVGTKVGKISNVFLSTVVLVVRDLHGGKQLARALLDNGSQANIMSERLCQMLNLKRRSANVPISGIGQSETRARFIVNTTVSSRIQDFSVGMEFLVLQKVTSELPSAHIPVAHWNIPKDIQLADPNFNTSNRIDLLIGGEHFYRFLYEREMKRIVLGPGLPMLINSVFGYIVTGKVSDTRDYSVSCCVAATPGQQKSDNLEAQLRRFWEIESSEDRPAWSKEEQDSEDHFVKTFSRTEEGRYVVRLPKHINYGQMLGNSHAMALTRFRRLEKQLERNPDMRLQYNAFMQEYLNLGHMREVNEEELSKEMMSDNSKKVCYLPHHAVLKETSTTTKVRVVFDGSATTDSGYSLNDALLKGPVIQDELLSLLIRFRKHEVALVGDVEKMYRQVKVHPEDAGLQRILFRFSPEEPIRVFELSTVTYGLTPSSFLAIRALHQLASDEGVAYSEAAKAIVHDFYVDDYIGGASSVDEAIQLQGDLNTLMKKGGFALRKWCSNRPEVLTGIPADQLGTNLSISFDISPEEKVKTLGITWEPGTDQLRFIYENVESEQTWTRRTILSSIAKLFDPLGLISPVVIVAKMLMQELASRKIAWDTPVPDDIKKKWTAFYSELDKIAELRINRFAFASNWVDIQFHCFADASTLAYGACLYVRTTDHAGNVRIELLASKSRVAPLQRLPIPRLELCAAKEAALLHSKVTKALSLGEVRSTFWSDSTIVLHWLRAAPNTWQTFVANRVSAIQTSTHPHSWRHIAGKENPADLVSRGMTIDDFLHSQLWNEGPPWIRDDEDTWPYQVNGFNPPADQLEIRKVVHQATVAEQSTNDLFSLRSSLPSLLRIVAYCHRFVHNCRFPNDRRRDMVLTAEEIQAAKMALTRLAQAERFSEEFKALQHQQRIHRKSKLNRLFPFLDSDGVLRVGGRLRFSTIGYAAKHPAILPSNHPFTDLVIRYFHYQNFHSGPQLTLSEIRQEFWPIHGRRAVNNVLRKCIRCFRSNPAPIQQPMGQLPAGRVRPGRPFLITGVDYCGPFYLKPPRRNAAPPKVYIAVFVCFSTKSMHLEMASDLSTASFLSVLRRFIGYRGVPAEIHSDNATNFSGARNELKALYDLLNNSVSRTTISNELSQQGIQWKFIPPRAPNFGGLWEAAVRSVKTALKKEIGLQQLTYDNFLTLIVQITATLNSRPLSPLSDDPTEFEALTPAHFLIGSSMKALPEPILISIPTNRLNHYQQTQQMFQRYWQRWSKQYLTQLQVTTRNLPINPMQVGSIVVLREDNLPPLCWPLARIISLHPGSDGIVRVVTVKTAAGVYKRAVNRICPLPTEDVNRRTTRASGLPAISDRN